MSIRPAATAASRVAARSRSAFGPSLAALVSVLALVPGTSPADTPPRLEAAAGALPCTVRKETGASLELDCALAAGEPVAKVRFTAAFSGGHDDTMAAVSVTLNGSPAACEAGSKPNLQGEDGDVSLVCLLTIGGDSAPVGFKVAWSHAQFVRARLDRVSP